MTTVESQGRVVRIGVLGCGNVGAAFVRLVEQQSSVIEQRTGVRLEIVSVAVRNMSRDRDVQLSEGLLTRDAHSVVADPNVDLVVEMIGGIEPARELISSALAAGKPVVTANKELLANIDLSRLRAQSVRSALLKQYGATPAQIDAQGAGYLAPRASNETPEGRALNRRVEVLLNP